jgi:hypothetical protein
MEIDNLLLSNRSYRIDSCRSGLTSLYFMSTYAADIGLNSHSDRLISRKTRQIDRQEREEFERSLSDRPHMLERHEDIFKTLNV